MDLIVLQNSNPVVERWMLPASAMLWYRNEKVSKSENCLTTTHCHHRHRKLCRPTSFTKTTNLASPACLIRRSPGNVESQAAQLFINSSCSSSSNRSSSNSQATDFALESATAINSQQQSNISSDDDQNSTTGDHRTEAANMSLLVNNGSRENLKLSSSVNYSSQLDPKNSVSVGVGDYHHGNECTRNLDQLIDISNSKSPWDILCQLINCKVAFKKQFNGKKYTWIQLAGHPGRFKPGEREGFILKLMDELERKSFETLKSDILGPFVPAVDRVLYDMNDGNYYTEMQDLLYSFNNPSIMDIKIGVRTFIIDESDEKETMPRHDLYLKMNKIAANELTEEEHQRQAINKRRYMSWRECSTCSSTLGFRIEAIKKNHVSEKEFYNIKEKKDVQAHIRSYTNNKKYILHMYKNRLLRLRETLLQSEFFYSHEMIGSSLLFVHDDRKASIWMIDFGKTRPLPEGVKLRHDVKWEEGNYEDGYLIGINSLIDIFNEALNS